MNRKIQPPAREQLRDLLRVKSQPAIAAEFGCAVSTVNKWVKDYGLRRVVRTTTKEYQRKRRKQKRAEYLRRRNEKRIAHNPLVQCLCGCGATFVKYAFYRDNHGSLVRYSRAFLPQHHKRTTRLEVAQRVAARWDRTGDRSREGLRWSVDFSGEALGEAWLALAEGDNPIDRCTQAMSDSVAKDLPGDVYSLDYPLGDRELPFGEYLDESCRIA